MLLWYSNNSYCIMKGPTKLHTMLFCLWKLIDILLCKPATDTRQCDRVTWKRNTGPFQLLVWLGTKTQWMGFDHRLNANFLWCWNCTEGLRPLLSFLQRFCRLFQILMAALLPPGYSPAASPLWFSSVPPVEKHHIRRTYYYFSNELPLVS